ncbi:hypothetical protein FRC01_008218 [Tulasnella sp. 417]|nr:hypothetical protein FRC01_008218 [Tulasnella sp. 417]
MFGEDSPGAPSLSEFVAILTRNAGTLISLTVDESNITHEVEGSDLELEKELVLPNLVKLQMTQLDRDVYFWMVRCLRCPKVVEYIGNPGQHDMEFTSMVQKQPRTSPFPNVRRLKVQYSLIWDPNEPRGIALKELTFNATLGLSAKVLTQIVKSRSEARDCAQENGNDQPYPPKLEKLVLRGCPMSLAAEEMAHLKNSVAEFEWSEVAEGCALRDLVPISLPQKFKC